MSKTADKRAIKTLPALRASLIWYKRHTVKELRRRAEDMVSPIGRRMLESKADKIARLELAELRGYYQTERIAEIRRAPLIELAQVVPGLVRLSAHL